MNDKCHLHSKSHHKLRHTHTQTNTKHKRTHTVILNTHTWPNTIQCCGPSRRVYKSQAQLLPVATSITSSSKCVQPNNLEFSGTTRPNTTQSYFSFFPVVEEGNSGLLSLLEGFWFFQTMLLHSLPSSVVGGNTVNNPIQTGRTVKAAETIEFSLVMICL